MKLIVGLGNPGDKYLNTRHNLGFEVIEHFRRKMELGDWQPDKKFKAEIIISNIQSYILVRPLTYMNLSGMAVSQIAKYYKIKPKDILIIHDDLDLLMGKMKLRLGGGAAGHHGVESIIEYLRTDGFARLRLGIGNTAGFLGEHKRTSFSAEKFVMEAFEDKERSKVKAMVKRAVQVVETYLEEGIEKAQNQYH